MLDDLHKALRAAVAVIGHSLIAAKRIAGATLMERLIFALNAGRELVACGPLSVSHLFQTIDATVVAAFGLFGPAKPSKIVRGP